MARHFDDILADATGARSLHEQQQQPAENGDQEATTQSPSPGSLTVGGIGLGAVSEWEKTDLMFWLIALQTLLLLLIWLELLRR